MEMRFQVTQLNDHVNIHKTDYNLTGVIKLGPNYHTIILDVFADDVAKEETMYLLALANGMKAINNFKFNRWRKDFGQL